MSHQFYKSAQTKWGLTNSLQFHKEMNSKMGFIRKHGEQNCELCVLVGVWVIIGEHFVMAGRRSLLNMYVYPRSVGGPIYCVGAVPVRMFNSIRCPLGRKTKPSPSGHAHPRSQRPICSICSMRSKLNVHCIEVGFEFSFYIVLKKRMKWKYWFVFVYENASYAEYLLML